MQILTTAKLLMFVLFAVSCNNGAAPAPNDGNESGPISRPSEGGSSAPPTGQQPSIIKPVGGEFMGLMTVPDAGKLPECTPARAGQVLYVKSESSFKNCEEKDWVTLDLRGPKGDSGAIGQSGPAGAQGPQGVIGATGLQGPQGATGPQGLPGSVGPQGPIGATGAIGPTGPQGIQGPQGAQGASGPTGAKGDKGDPGDRILGGNLVDTQNEVMGQIDDVLDYYGSWMYGAADQYLLVKKGNYRTIYYNPLYYTTFHDGYGRYNALYLRGSSPRGSLVRRMNDGNDRGFFKHYIIYESNDCSGTPFLPAKIPDGVINFIDEAAPLTGTGLSYQALQNWTAINTFDGMNLLYSYSPTHDFFITQECRSGQRDGAYFNSIKRPGLACERVCASTSASVRDYSTCVGGQPADFTGCPITLVPKEFPDEVSAGWRIVPPGAAP